MALPLTDAEFESILGDEEKRIPNDIAWTEDEDHSPAWEFRANVESGQGSRSSSGGVTIRTLGR